MSLNVHQKISNLRESIEGFSKDANGYKYSYVSGNQVLGMIKNNMDALHLLLVPEINYDSLSVREHIGTKLDKFKKEVPKYTYVLKFRMNYVWIDADNPEDRLIVPWMALGEQEEDIAKAFGTALTYTERYFLLKFFNLPTDVDDPDYNQIKPVKETKATEIKTTLPVQAVEAIATNTAKVPEVEETLISGEGTPVTKDDGIPFDMEVADPNAEPEIPISKMNKGQTLEAIDKFFFAKDEKKTKLLGLLGIREFKAMKATELKSLYKKLLENEKKG